MDEQTVDQAGAAPVTPATTTAPKDAVSTSVVGQATPAVGTGASPIVVGNQTFQTPEELAKAYQESMRGHTQATQRYAKEMEAYKAVSDWLNNLKKDQTQWGRFTQYVYGKPDVSGQVSQQAAQLQAQAGATTPQMQDTRFDEFKSDLEGRLEAQKTQVEYLTFRNQHPDVDDQTLQEVIDQVVKWDDEGKERSMEEGYRWIMAEKNAAKFVAAGQKKAEDALAASRQAGGTLGTAPASATGIAKPEAKFKDMKTVKDQNNFIRNKLGQFLGKK